MAATHDLRKGRRGQPRADRARVLRRRRAAFASTVGGFVLAVVVLVGGLSSPARPGRASAPGMASLPTTRPVRATFYVARPGDTLWAIAERLAPGADPRPLVDRLAAELPGGILVAGDRLALPPPG